VTEKTKKGIDDLEDMPEYQVGLWYSPYVKIYSIGGPNRIAEISTYPRAYKDTTPHVYTEDTPFIVTEGDLNDEVDGKRVYCDSKGKTFHIGEEATRWTGDPLPGAFPLWLENEDIPFTVDQENHIFNISDIPRPLLNLAEAQIKFGDAYIKLSKGAIDTIKKKLATSKITMTRQLHDEDKQIIRIKYQRMF